MFVHILNTTCFFNKHLNFYKVDGDAALRPKRRGCAPQRNEKGMYEDVNLRRDKRDLALCGQCGKTSG